MDKMSTSLDILKKFLKLIIPMILLGFLIRTILSDWVHIEKYIFNLNPFIILISLLVLLTVYPEAAFSWYLLIKKDKIKMLPAIRVWIMATTSRYIPGIIWQYLGRVELAKKQLNLSRITTTISLVEEIILSLLSASFLSIFVFNNISVQYRVTILASLVVLTLLILTSHSIIKKTINFLTWLLNKKQLEISSEVSQKKLLTCLPFFVLNFFLNGLALLLIQFAFTHDVNFSIFNITGIFAISWLLGFIAVFAPGGLGVSDTSLAFLFNIYYGINISLASAIAISFRILLTISELLVFLIALRYNPSNEG